jgi:hypothetical protein
MIYPPPARNFVMYLCDFGHTNNSSSIFIYTKTADTENSVSAVFFGVLPNCRC